MFHNMPFLTFIRYFLLCRNPDAAPIKAKMLYASTKDAVKKKLGGGIKSVQVFNSVEDWETFFKNPEAGIKGR